MGNPLITRQEYKSYANLTNPNSDAEIDNLIPKVSELVKTYCNRSFVDWIDEVKIEHFNGDSQYLILKECPVIEVLEVAYSSDYGVTYTPILEHRDWVLDEDLIISTARDGFRKALRGYRVSYTAGYSSIPDDLKLAVMDLLTYYRRNDMAAHTSKGTSSGSMQIEYITATGFPSHIRRVLDFYRGSYA